MSRGKTKKSEKDENTFFQTKPRPFQAVCPLRTLPHGLSFMLRVHIFSRFLLHVSVLACIFTVTFNLPCVVALAATYQEIHSVKRTLKIAAYYTVTALLLSCIAYHVGLLIW